jgi:hypothetical protein
VQLSFGTVIRSGKIIEDIYFVVGGEFRGLLRGFGFREAGKRRLKWGEGCGKVTGLMMELE